MQYDRNSSLYMGEMGSELKQKYKMGELLLLESLSNIYLQGVYIKDKNRLRKSYEMLF